MVTKDSEWTVRLLMQCKALDQCETNAKLRISPDQSKYELYVEHACTDTCTMDKLLDKKLLISLNESKGIRLFASQIKPSVMDSNCITFEVESSQYDLLQRRRFLRIPVNWPSVLMIDLSPPSAAGTHIIYHECDILDLSAGGFKVKGINLLPQDRLLALSFSLPELEVSDTLGRIVWQKEEAGGVLTAIEFIGVDSSTENDLVSYVFKQELAHRNQELEVTQVQIMEPFFTTPIETGFRPMEFKGRKLRGLENKKATCTVVNMTLDHIYVESYLKLPEGLVIELELCNPQEGTFSCYAFITECVTGPNNTFILKLELDKGSDSLKRLARHIFYSQLKA